MGPGGRMHEERVTDVDVAALALAEQLVVRLPQCLRRARRDKGSTLRTVESDHGRSPRRSIGANDAASREIHPQHVLAAADHVGEDRPRTATYPSLMNRPMSAA